MVDYALNEYHTIRHAELLGSAELREAWGEVAKALYFKNLLPGERVLEFGGGLGANLEAVASRWDAWMVEPAPIGREIASRSGVRAVASLDAIDASVIFDYVLCRHCLEHVDEPLDVLRSLRGRMRRDAQLVLVLPVESPDLMPVENDIDHHLYSWNPRAIANLLERAGFRVTDVRFESFTGRRRLLPVRRLFGSAAYVKGVRMLGSIFHSRELLLSALA